MRYRNSSYASGAFDTFWFEKNLQGDIVAVYDEGGNLLVSYVYDAWGKAAALTPAYHNGGASTAAQYNPFRYRGYYYDSELGFYYLNSRYYDPETGRFVNADSVMSGVNGSLHGSNLFVYCFNDPINLTDSVGNWPKWMEKAAAWAKENIVKPTVDAVVNFVDAAYKSIETELGLGFGIGGDVSNNVTAEFSRDTYVGIDDGCIVTGNVITAEVKAFSKLGIGRSYNHLVEKDLERVSNSGSVFDGPFDMINYSDVTAGNQFAFGLITLNHEGEWLISLSASAHLGVGGHISFSFNLSEFIERLGN